MNFIDPSGFDEEGGGGCYSGCGPQGGPLGVGGSPSINGTAAPELGTYGNGQAPGQGSNGYTNTSANPNQTPANGTSIGGVDISGAGSGSEQSIAEGRMAGGNAYTQQGGGPGGDTQQAANQQQMSDPNQGSGQGTSQQSSNNRTASPAPGLGERVVGAMILGGAGLVCQFAGCGTANALAPGEHGVPQMGEDEKIMRSGLAAGSFLGAGIIGGIVGKGLGATERALTAADLGLSGRGVASLVGSVSNAGSTRIINVASVKAVSPGALVSELRGAVPNILSFARAQGVQTLQITGTFANSGLQQFATSQAAQYGGTVSSVSGVDTITFILR